MIPKTTLQLQDAFLRFSRPIAFAGGLLTLVGCGTPRYLVNPDSCETSTTTEFRLGETPVGVISTGQILTSSRVDHGFNDACERAKVAVRLGMTQDPEKGTYLSAALRVLIHFYNAAQEEVKRHVEARLATFHKIGVADLPKLELAVRKAELKAAGHNTDFGCRNETGSDGFLVRKCGFIKEEEIKVEDPVTGAPAGAPPPPTPAS